MLSGDVWPVHFPPYSDESLTSWFSRLAIYQFQLPWTLLLRAAPHRVDAWKQDLDVICPEDLMRIIGGKCALSSQTLLRHTLTYWRSRFDPYSGASSALPRWVSPAYVRRISRHHYGMRVCPACMREKAYHRLFFRLAFVFGCSKHSSSLIDRCGECLAPISTHRIFPGLIKDCPGDALAYCYRCGADYRSASVSAIGSQSDGALVFNLQALKKGFCRPFGTVMHYSHLYFQGLRLVAKGLLRPRLAELCNDNPFNMSLTGELFGTLRKHGEIEFLPTGSAHQVLTLAHLILQSWPDQFLEICGRYGLSYSDWIQPRDVAPYWLSSIAKVHLRRAPVIYKGR